MSRPAVETLAEGKLDPAMGKPAGGTDSWCTPKWLTDLLGAFDLDPCSNERSHVQSTFLMGPFVGTSGLVLHWKNYSVFCNPPYSKPLPWALKLRDHAGPWVALLKLDPTTRWWAALMEVGPTVAPFRRRITFEGEQRMTANFPSVLVYSAWRPSRELAKHLWLPTYPSVPREPVRETAGMTRRTR